MEGYCQRCLTWRRRLHRDHVIPKWRGGPDEEYNVQYLCANCHEDKTWQEQHSTEFREYMRAIMNQKKRVQARKMRRMWQDPEYRDRVKRGRVK